MKKLLNEDFIIFLCLCIFTILFVNLISNGLYNYKTYNILKQSDYYKRLINDNILKEHEKSEDKFLATFDNLHEIKTMKDIKEHLFTIDPTAYVTKEDLKINELVNMDMRINLYGQEPKILIFHTHSQEGFLDSEEGNSQESIVAVGRYLAEIFAYKYGVSVVHDLGIYDMENNEIKRGKSYEKMEPSIKEILEKYPSIEVLIDVHRDGVPEAVHLVTNIDGNKTAKIMFFNGITKLNNDGEVEYMPDLVNPYLKENLALSLQLFLTANEKYPGFARKTYIKPYRYSLHLKPRSILVEVGANTNTLEEAKNAMYPLADIIYTVLSLD